MKKITKRAYEIMLEDATLESKKSKHRTDRNSALCYAFMAEVKGYIKAAKLDSFDTVKGTFNLACAESVNNGTSRWAKMGLFLQMFENLKYERETSCYYFFKEKTGRIIQIKKDRIIAIIK